jgi:hypothetical protein
VGTGQVDLAGDGGLVGELKVAVGGQPDGGQPGQVASGQQQCWRPRLIQNHGLGEPAAVKQQQAD